MESDFELLPVSGLFPVIHTLPPVGAYERRSQCFEPQISDQVLTQVILELKLIGCTQEADFAVVWPA